MNAPCEFMLILQGGMNETITMSQCALQRGVSYKALGFSAVEIVSNHQSMPFQSLEVSAYHLTIDLKT